MNVVAVIHATLPYWLNNKTAKRNKRLIQRRIILCKTTRLRQTHRAVALCIVHVHCDSDCYDVCMTRVLYTTPQYVTMTYS